MVRPARSCLAAVALMILVSSVTAAQQVNVTVDGIPVQFTGTKPLTQQGRVLVPLRGVLEKMGAFVEWAPATRTVVAQRGNTHVELPVGSQTATVDGRQVTLDVPAAVMGGSTMVPLRFVGEALGADVRWDAPSRTVVIATTGTGSTAGGVTPQSHISSFTHDAAGWLRAGSTIHVTLTGVSGGNASFEIPGVVDSVKMTESGSGRYTGSWTVPANANVTVSGAALIGMLKAGGKEQLIQAAANVSIDTVPPRISDRRPGPDSRVAQTRPGISATLDDGSGSGVDASSVKITVGGMDVTSQSTVTPSLVAYKPSKDIELREVAVAVSARDGAGNSTSATWEFAIKSASDVIKSLTHSDITNLEPGDVLTVKIEGEKGGTASFSIVRDGQTLRTQSMREVTAGNYEGEYTVRRDDRLDGAMITGTLKTAAGDVFTAESQETIGGGQAAALRPPAVTQPAQGAEVKSPITIKGNGTAGSSVRLRIEYVTTVLGMMDMKGTITDQMVEVDSNGNFASRPISLGTLVKGKNTAYTLTATTVDASGEESAPTTVTFKGS